MQNKNPQGNFDPIPDSELELEKYGIWIKAEPQDVVEEPEIDHWDLNAFPPASASSRVDDQHLPNIESVDMDFDAEFGLEAIPEMASADNDQHTRLSADGAAEETRAFDDSSTLDIDDADAVDLSEFDLDETSGGFQNDADGAGFESIDMDLDFDDSIPVEPEQTEHTIAVVPESGFGLEDEDLVEINLDDFDELAATPEPVLMEDVSTEFIDEFEDQAPVAASAADEAPVYVDSSADSELLAGFDDSAPEVTAGFDEFIDLEDQSDHDLLPSIAMEDVQLDGAASTSFDDIQALEDDLAEQSEQQVEQAELPAEQSEQAVQPPAEQAVPPAEQAVPPAEQAVPPAEQAVPPTEQAVPLAEQAVPPTEQAVPQPANLQSDLLMRIAAELASIKEELISLRTQIVDLRHEPIHESVEPAQVVPQAEPEAEAPGGFFDDEEDDTIALTGDELDNILNTADFTVEAAAAPEPASLDSSPVIQELELPPEPVASALEEDLHIDFGPSEIPDSLDLLPEDGNYAQMEELAPAVSEGQIDLAEEPGIEPINLVDLDLDTSADDSRQTELDSMELPDDIADIRVMTPAPEDTSYLDDELAMGTEFDLEASPQDVPLVEPDPAELTIEDTLQETLAAQGDEDIPFMELADETEPAVLDDASSIDEPYELVEEPEELLLAVDDDYATPAEDDFIFAEPIDEIEGGDELAIDPYTDQSLTEITLHRETVDEGDSAGGDSATVQFIDDSPTEEALVMDFEELPELNANEFGTLEDLDESLQDDEPGYLATEQSESLFVEAADTDFTADLTMEAAVDGLSEAEEPSDEEPVELLEELDESDGWSAETADEAAGGDTAELLEELVEDDTEALFAEAADEAADEAAGGDTAELLEELVEDDTEALFAEAADEAAGGNTAELLEELDEAVPEEPVEEAASKKPALMSSAPSSQEEPANDAVPDRLKDDIKSILVYLDQLLAALPEDKIEEFASSEYYDTYKKLFEDLGLI
jgi:hypothetical protein